MKDLSLNELLRYFSIGVLTIMLLYIPYDKNLIAANIKIFGSGDVFGIFIFIAFTIGTIIYILYRSFFYPLIFNPLISLFFLDIYRKMFNSEKMDIWEAIFRIDSKRWTTSDENIKKRLSEWASQVHFLYNISMTFLYISIISCFYTYVSTIKCWFIYFLLSFILSAVHHYRYKMLEVKILLPN
jgi:hypothetical protein